MQHLLYFVISLFVFPKFPKLAHFSKISFCFFFLLLFNRASGAQCNYLTATEFPTTSPLTASFSIVDTLPANNLETINEMVLTPTAFYFLTHACVWLKIDLTTYSIAWANTLGDSGTCASLELCPNGTCLLSGSGNGAGMLLAIFDTATGNLNYLNVVGHNPTYTFIWIFGNLALLLWF